MNRITNNSRAFWECNPKAMKVLYGAGINAEHIIKLANKANFKIDCIIDKNPQKNCHLYEDIYIYTPTYFKENISGQKEVQIYISINDTFGAISEINTHLENTTVFLPVNEKGALGHNLAVAPLRNKLLKNKEITFISNSCFAARLYQLHDLPFNTPTIATIIESEDYLKFCLNFREYINKELKFYCKQEWFIENYYHVTCMLDDIKIRFMHQENYDSIKENWDKRVKRINYDNLVFIWDYNHYPATYDILKKFSEMKNKKMIFFSEVSSPISIKNSISNFSIYTPSTLIEKKFLLTDWLNSKENF